MSSHLDSAHGLLNDADVQFRRVGCVAALIEDILSDLEIEQEASHQLSILLEVVQASVREGLDSVDQTFDSVNSSKATPAPVLAHKIVKRRKGAK